MPTTCYQCGREAPCVSPNGLADIGWRLMKDGWRCFDCNLAERELTDAAERFARWEEANTAQLASNSYERAYGALISDVFRLARAWCEKHKKGQS